MKVTSFLACQYGTYTIDGFVDLCGVGVQWIEAGSFPEHVDLQFFARCEPEVTDIPGPHAATLVFMGLDRIFARIERTFEVGVEMKVQHLLMGFELVFEAAGDFRVDLFIDGRPVGKAPIKAYRVRAGSHTIKAVEKRRGGKTRTRIRKGVTIGAKTTRREPLIVVLSM